MNRRQLAGRVRCRADRLPPLAFAPLAGPRAADASGAASPSPSSTGRNPSSDSSCRAKAQSLAGKPVQILGYMAPPLKAEMGFFVLTRAPVALCPFCNSDADWPTDIVVVYPRDGARVAHDGLPVAVSGILELGSKTDPQTGFVSLVRIVDANVKELR